MKKGLIAVAAILVGAYAVRIGWLVCKHSWARPLPQVSDAVLVQMDVLMQSVSKFQAELEKTAGQAKYPGEEDKAFVDEVVRNKAVLFEVTKVNYENAKHQRTVMAMGPFLLSVSTFATLPPEVFQSIDPKTKKLTPYVDLTALHTLESQIGEQAAALARQIR